jgi:flagellar hook-length control protein FliK
LSSNKQQTPVQPTAITVDVSVANGQSDARNNTTKSSENKISNNSLQNIIINDNSQIVTEVPIADNKMAVVQRLQQMLNNTLAQAVQIIQTIPMKSQAIQQPMILTSDFINKAELFTENDNITMQETQRPILSLDEPIMGIKSSKNFFNHLSALTDKLITTMPQQEKLTKSAPVISQVIAADNSNTFKIESKEQNTEKNMQLSAILSNNTVNNMQKNDDNNSKVVNVNPSRIIEQIAKNVQPIKKDGKHEIILRLDPPTLGEIRVRISSDQNGIVTANIEAVHSSVRDSLAARVPELRQALQDAGLSLDKCQVSLSNDRSFNNQFTNQSGNGRWQNDNRQQTNGQEAFIPLPDLSPDNTEMKMPETATMNYLV